jgi:anti-sigma regulatory factor (Ser/Thr protein kinase)
MMPVLRTFDPTPESVRDARRLARAAAAHLTPERRDDVVLVVSELAANAVRHAQTPYSVHVAVDGVTVRVEVVDHGGGMPVRRHPSVTATGGRGLQIVDELALTWGVDMLQHGKMVWAELAAVPRG